MTVTRDPDYPTEAAALFQMFNRCAEGTPISLVVDVAANFFVCSMREAARVRDLAPEEAERWLRATCENMVKLLNKPRPADAVMVPPDERH
jgi:hypothetical protein